MNRPHDRLLPVLLSAPQDGGERSAREGRPAAGFAAQMQGQPGIKRGLRGGAPVLAAARSAYLGAEYSGVHDRRPPHGLLVKTAI